MENLEWQEVNETMTFRSRELVAGLIYDLDVASLNPQGPTNPMGSVFSHSRV